MPSCGLVFLRGRRGIFFRVQIVLFVGLGFLGLGFNGLGRVNFLLRCFRLGLGRKNFAEVLAIVENALKDFR